MLHYRVPNPFFPSKLAPALAVAALLSCLAPAQVLGADEVDETAAGAEASAPSERGDAEADAEDEESPRAGTEPQKDGTSVTARYRKGLLVESEDGNFSMLMNVRGQFRMTDVSSDDLFAEDDGVKEEAGFQIRRARLKLKGHAYRPWLKYKFEYALVGNSLLTFRMDVAKKKEFNLWVGQYKLPYNRERLDSSGQLQFVDRSIVTRPFTVDRQQGLTLTGRLFEGKRADSNYAVGMYTGTGRGGGLEADRNGMYIARWQWNFLKRLLPSSQSDLKRYPKARASVAVAAATNTGRFTRFSSSGGGNLPGFDETDDPDRYKLDQWMAEYSYMHRGFSAQSEYHFKRIDDRELQQVTELDGWYGQIGYFFNEVWDSFPRQLELALRAAAVDPIAGVNEIPVDRELTFGLNWFFHGHNNKLTFDVSRLESTIAAGSEDTGLRARLQWDISF